MWQNFKVKIFFEETALNFFSYIFIIYFSKKSPHFPSASYKKNP